MQFISRLISNVSWWLGKTDPHPPVAPKGVVEPVQTTEPVSSRVRKTDVPYAKSDFSAPSPVVEKPAPAAVIVIPPVVVTKEDRTEARNICKNLMDLGQMGQVSVAHEMQKMTPSVRACFLELATVVEREMLNVHRNVPLGKPQIISLLLGEALAAEAAGRNSASAQSLLENLRCEWAYGKTSVVKTEQGFVGEAFHIMVAAYLRHGQPLTFKVPNVAGANIYAANFDNLVVANNPGAPPLSRAGARDIPDLSKKDLTALIVGGPTALPKTPRVQDIQDGVYDMLTGGLTPETRHEIGERSATMLMNAGMPANEPKLGIVIRNVKPGAGGGTVDTSNNMSRQRMLDCLSAAHQAGIRNIVFFGDPLDERWIKGTPWDPLLARHGGSEHRYASLTEAWNPTAATSPLHNASDNLGPRRHLSVAQGLEAGEHGPAALQGGYAEQLCMYRELHRRANLLALVGNRSGAIDGPAFCGIPTIQILMQETAGEKVAGRLGLLPAIFPKYGLLNVHSPVRPDHQPAGSVPLSESNINDLSARLVQLGGGSV